jgi:CelD/BcsL family acetyltransferase involved in cellulose biosynthesis
MTAARHDGKGPHRDKKFFEILFKRLHDSDKLYWTGLVAEGALVGSQIHFIHGDTLFNWQTVSDYEKRQYKPSQLLMHDAIERAADLGLKSVNLGASPPDAGGLIRYKERWQGTRIDYYIYSSLSRIRKLLGR